MCVCVCVMCDARGGGRGGEQEGAAFKVLLTVASQEAYPVLLSSVRAVKSSSSSCVSLLPIYSDFFSLSRAVFLFTRKDFTTPTIDVLP